VDCIVELGCGYGRNLVELFFNGGPKIPYFGGELTETGRAIGDALASLSKEQTLSFHPFDHVSPDLSWMPRCNRALIYTVHSIEQVYKIDTTFFECIAGSAEHVTGLHLEPFGFQVNPDLDDVTTIQSEQFYPEDPLNPTSVTIWHHNK
jgi:hypothetical protein